MVERTFFLDKTWQKLRVAVKAHGKGEVLLTPLKVEVL